MDVTPNFKASVLATKSKKDEQGNNRFMQKCNNAKKPRCEFGWQAKEICHKITKLRDILLENRAAYMRIGQHLKGATYMTDEQRNIIDRESEKCIAFYTQQLANMRQEWLKIKRKPQEKAHIAIVVELLASYLQTVNQLHQEQKKYRLEYELETHRLLKLAADIKKIPERTGCVKKPNGSLKPQETQNSYDDESSEVEETTNDLVADLDWEWGDDEHIQNSTESQQSALEKDNTLQTNRLNSANSSSDALQTEQKLSSSQVALDQDMEKSRQEVESRALTPEDVQLFEEENVQLYNELQGLADEVEQIEKSVVDIAQLQDMFTEKVSLQQQNIERIVSTVIGTTENVKSANEQIRQATQRNAGLRVWTLMLLMIMSFTLLLLDWIYD